MTTLREQIIDILNNSDMWDDPMADAIIALPELRRALAIADFIDNEPEADQDLWNRRGQIRADEHDDLLNRAKKAGNAT